MGSISWWGNLRRSHGSVTFIALAMALILLATLVAYQSIELRDQGRRRLAEADRLAGDRASRLEEAMARATAVPGFLFAGGLATRDAGALETAARQALNLSGIVTSLELQADDRPAVTITAATGVRGGPLSLPSTAPLRPSGQPLVTVDGHELLIVQSLVSGDARTNGRFWGYANARVALSQLARELHVADLAADGFTLGLRFERDRISASVVLLGPGEASHAASSVRHVALPQGGRLRLTVTPPGTAATPANALLIAGLTALGGLVLILAWQLGRRPASTVPAGRGTAQASLEREVNARLLAEEHLERSHAMLDSMLENFPGLVVIKRAADLRITRINQSAERILGRARETLIGRASDEIYAPEFAERMRATDRQALETGELVQMSLERVQMPGQPVRWLHYRKLALLDRAGRPQYVLEFGEDMTERERLYHQMREHLHFVEQLLDAIPGALFYKDAQGRYLGVNTAFEAFIGRNREELVGKTVYDISPPHLAATYDEADRALLASGATQIYESQVRRSDGSTAEVMFHKAVFRATDGEKGGIVGFALDISERKAAEHRVAQLNRILTVLGETSQLIIQIHERDQLLNRAGTLLQEKGGFPVAWIQVEDSDGPMIFGSAAASAAVSRLLLAIGQASRRCAPENRLSCRRLDCCDPEVAAELQQLGLHSMLHLPLEYQGAVRGSIGILGSEADLFDKDEDRLLEELAANLSHALEALAQEKARRLAEEKLQLAGRVFENNAEGIIVTDASNRIVMVNRAFSQVTGYAAAEVVGKNPSLLASGRQDAQFYRSMWQTLRQKGEWRGEVVNRRKSGEYYPEWLTISVVKNEGGEITNHVAVFSDLTARKQVEERLNFLAHYDALTALPNRILFTDRLDRALVQAARSGQRVALFFLDLDRFKLINESIGHSAGDRLLKEVSLRLKALVGDDDSVSRLGGDHFAVFVSGLASAEEAAAFGRRLQGALEPTLRFEDQEIHVSASIGISIFPEDGADSESLAMNADSAMYQAIADGGNRARFFRQDMNERSSERVHLEGKLHHALDRGEFRVFFQPFIAAGSGRIVGGEALLRWSHADLGGAVSPATFIPLLEDTGLISGIGDWVLRRAAEEAIVWRELTGEKLLVAVNVSAVQLSDDELPRKVGRLLAELALDPACLEIELTESAVMRDPRRGIRLLQEFKALGVQLSVDDFGTGYSSLSYLKQLPINTLKIDRSFVMDTPSDHEAVTIARAIVAMGHSLGLHVIAEGVESPAQVNFLRDSGVDILQGFYYSKAVSAEEFRQLLRAQMNSGLREPPVRNLQLLAG